ncbi:hypothetical protein [Tenacibaculum sp.]|uniref:hypothetical protein n=1 Tax=Tenacibaculum sp. TaxID=1906242 RepID=UPI003D119C02
MITTLSATIWLLLGLIVSLFTQYLHKGLYNIKSKDVIMTVLATVFWPACFLVIIPAYIKGSELYVPTYLRYNRSRINKLPLKDKHLFSIWRNAELNIKNFPDTLELLFKTGYFKEKSLVIKFVNTRYEDFKLSCKVQRLIEEENE